MKRKPKHGLHERPAWQALPMGQLVAIVRGWEDMKILREAIKRDPVELAALSAIEATRAAQELAMVQSLDEIGPNARVCVKAWLESPGGSPAHYVEMSDPGKAICAVVSLWEGFLAACEIAPEARDRWLAELPSEARLLVNRLARRVPTEEAR